MRTIVFFCRQAAHRRRGILALCVFPGRSEGRPCPPVATGKRCAHEITIPPALTHQSRAHHHPNSLDGSAAVDAGPGSAMVGAPPCGRPRDTRPAPRRHPGLQERTHPSMRDRSSRKSDETHRSTRAKPYPSPSSRPKSRDLLSPCNSASRSHTPKTQRRPPPASPSQPRRGLALSAPGFNLGEPVSLWFRSGERHSPIARNP